MPAVSADEFYDALAVWLESPNFNATTEGDFTDYFVGDVPFAYRMALPDGSFRYWMRAEIE